jgi:RsiW-degrading membrane proteinase PrsW (M82 family)
VITAALFIAFLGGVLPALLWLVFWLLEDRVHPEPKRYIFFCFVGGMFVVAVALFLEQNVILLQRTLSLLNTEAIKMGSSVRFPEITQAGVLFLWATIEEALKFLVAYFIALRSKEFDEPLDAVVYMVTVALGFSAAENTLFILNPLIQGNILQTIVTGDLRFIGATLLHTLSSATIGISLAFAFYHTRSARIFAAFYGLILAVALHTLFNFFILVKGPTEFCVGSYCGQITFWIFLTIWLGIIAILLGVERVKRPAPRYL